MNVLAMILACLQNVPLMMMMMMMMCTDQNKQLVL